MPVVGPGGGGGAPARVTGRYAGAVPSTPAPVPAPAPVIVAPAEPATAGTLATVAVVALGGGAGSLARYAMSLLLPHDAGGGVPWSTFTVNVAGSMLIGALTVLVTGRHPLLRPLLGIGFLGGFTTFSTFAVDAVVLVDRGAYATAAAYVAGTLAAALAGVSAGVAVTRRVAGR